MIFDKEYFEKVFEKRGWGEPTSAYERVKYIRQMEAIKQQCRQPQQILEIGCAEGIFTHMLAQTFPQARILAVDISTQAINRARETCQSRGNVHFLEADIVEVFHRGELPGGAFDAIIQSESLYYLFPRMLMRRTLLSYFRGMTLTLKDSGIFLTSNGIGFPSNHLMNIYYYILKRSCMLDYDIRYTEWNAFRKKYLTYDVKVFKLTGGESQQPLAGQDPST